MSVVVTIITLVIVGCRPPTSLPNVKPSTESASRSSADNKPQDVEFIFQSVGPEFFFRPTITHVQVVDLDGDGRQEVVACDSQQNGVFRYDYDDGQWRETRLADGLIAPAHATVVDIDADGDLDIIVSVMGNLHPDDSVIGSVVLLEHTAPGKFTRSTILDDVRRVVDVQSGDFDRDGDLDLAVAVFGYLRGEVLWLENLGRGQFLDHQLLAAPGTIHVPVADFDNDGDLDIAAVVSQEEEEVWVFENDGRGHFANRRIFFTINFDIGSAGLVQADLDRDGDVDLLLPVGDNLEDKYSYPQPYHGCIWLENRGQLNFTRRRLANFPGTYAAAVGDLDQDNDEDVVLVSMINEWTDKKQSSVVWMENVGDQQFESHPVASRPIQLTTVAVGDVDHDGRPDIVAGGLHVFRPFEAMGRISAWLRTGASSPSPVVSDRFQKQMSDTADGVPRPHLSLADPFTEHDLEQLFRTTTQRVDTGDATTRDWQTLGEAWFAYGFFKEAAQCFDDAMVLSPNFDTAYWRAMSSSRVGQVETAVNWFERARALAVDAKDRQECDLQLGRCHLRLEQGDQARKLFVRAGDMSWALLELAKLELRSGNPKAALAPLDRLSRQAPFAIEYLLLRGRVGEALNEPDAANFRSLAEYNERRLPESDFVVQLEGIRDRFGLRRRNQEANALMARQQYDEAAAILASTLDEAWSQSARLSLALAYLKSAKPSLAIEQLTSLLRERGDFPQALVLLGDAQLANGNTEAAESIWKRTAALRSGIGLHQRLRSLYENQGQHEKARQQDALRLQATGIADLRHSKLRLAKQAFQQALKIDDTLASSWFYLGECHRLHGEADKAQVAYRRCLALNPSHGRAYRRIQPDESHTPSALSNP